jgi:hypothetical protein
VDIFISRFRVALLSFGRLNGTREGLLGHILICR